MEADHAEADSKRTVCSIGGAEMREPIYALDELKRSFYLNCAMRQELPIILRDLFEGETVGEDVAEL